MNSVFPESCCKWLGCEIRRETDGFPAVKLNAVGHLSTRCPSSYWHSNEDHCFQSFWLLGSEWSEKLRLGITEGRITFPLWSVYIVAHPQLTIKPLSTSQSGLPPGSCTVTTPRNSGSCSSYSPGSCLKTEKQPKQWCHRIMMQSYMQVLYCICNSSNRNVVDPNEQPASVFDRWKYKVEIQLELIWLKSKNFVILCK